MEYEEKLSQKCFLMTVLLKEDEKGDGNYEDNPEIWLTGKHTNILSFGHILLLCQTRAI